MFKFLRVLFFSLFSFATFAQSLSIIRVNAENYCLGTELSIDVDVKGAFPSGNKFTVVAYRNWNDPTQRWEYPAELRGDKLVTVLKDPSLANSQTFGLKVLTSSPQTETDGYYSSRALTKAAVQLTTRWGYGADTLNSTDQIALAVVATPSTPGKVTLSSGDTLDLIYAWDWTASYPTVITLPKTKAGTYSIKEASNVCGPMAISGQVNIKVNPIDLMPVAVSPDQPCIGSEIKVIFSTNGGEFNANTKFRVRFASDNLYQDSYKYVDVPATLTGKNELTARVPENIPTNNVYLGIVTDNPFAVTVTKAMKMYAHPKPSFKLTTQYASVNLGETTSISASPTGIPPFKITLSSGEVMEYSLNVSPEKTTSYQVKTFESGCGVIQNPPNTPVTVTVNPSLLLANPSLTGNPKIACEGQTVRLGFHASGVSPQTTYSVEALTFNAKNFKFSAKVVGDSLEFFIPKNTSKDADLNYGEIWGVRAVSANPALFSPNISYKIQSPPTMVLVSDPQPGVPFPSAARLDFDLRGGNPYTVELVNGSIEVYDYRNVWFEQFVRRDTTFKLAKLSNACFTDTNPPSFPIKVLNPAGTTPSAFARLIRKPYCMSDSVEVELAFNGKFEAGNVFTLSYLGGAQSTPYPIRNVTKSGIYKVKLPVQNEPYDASLELSSSLPRLTSETTRFVLNVPPPNPTIWPQGKKEYPERMYLGELPRVYINATAYSPVVYSLDGVESKVMTDHNGRYEASLLLQNGKTSEFKVKSVINYCGAWNGEVTSYIHGIGYKLVVDPPINNLWHCVGTDASVNFSFESGKAVAGTKFTLQLSPTGDAGSYTDIASVTDSQVFRFVTPNLPAGGYYVRVYSSDNIYSEARTTLLIGHSPTATLAISYPTSGATTASVDYGTPVHMAASLTGNAPWGVVYSDGEQQIVTSNYSSYSPKVTGPQTFTVSKVWNSCGYGTATGTVSVTVKPVLEITKFAANADPAICPGQKIELDYALKGAELPGNAYLVFSILGGKGGTVKLDSVNRSSGRIQLTIPNDISGAGFFYIKADIASLQLSKSILYPLYATPDMTLFGDNVITAGEVTKLYVRSNATFAYNTTFELSDGKSYQNTAPYPGGVMEIKVTPGATTTYTLKPLQSACGMGRMSGSATITVQPKMAQWLSLQRVEGLRQTNVCNSDTVQVHFYLYGNQGNATDYEVLLSDSTGKNFAAIPTIGQSSPVMAIIPAGIKKASFYRLRINAKDPKVSGSTYAENLRIGERARAKVLTPSVAYQAGQPVNVVIGLEGSSPFYYRFGDDNFSRYRTALQYSDTIKLTPVTPLATYKISALTNECGPGTIGEPSSLTIELITGTEPVGEAISFGPNPTSNALFVQFEAAAVRSLEILNVAGQKVFAAKYTGKNATVDLSTLPPGVYLLQVRKKQTAATYRIVKY